jgi:anaerobic selenocysteine-containing dehydrogenase
VNHTEDLTSPTSAALVTQLTVTVNGNAVKPMLLTNGGTPNQRHSQWGNTTWIRDDMVTFLNGYRVIWINASDAAARGLTYGQLVKVYNNRGAIICAAKPTQRIMPGVVFLQEGGHPKPADPGTTGKGIATQTTNPTAVGPVDMGSNDNYLCEPWQSETICGGMSTHSGLVQIVPWVE